MSRRAALPNLLAVCLLGCASESEDKQPAKPNLLVSDQVLSIAHGGAQIEAPKQTMLSYQKAAEAKADVLEVDIWQSKDGVLVVIHDETVDATTDGTGNVADKTFEELEKLDAGYRFTLDGGQTFPYRGQGLKIPSFEQLLDAFPNAYWVVEIKQADPPVQAPLIDVLRKHGVDQRVIVASFDDAVIADFRLEAPDIFTSLATSEALQLLFIKPEQEATWSSPAKFLQPGPVGTINISQQLIELAHRLGLKVHPWTVNDPADMQHFIELGVDGIITDDPATLEGLLTAI